MTNKNISTTCTRVAMADKIGRMVTYLDGFLPIKLDDPPNLAGCWLTLRGSYPSYSTLRSRGLSRSRDKLKPLSPLPQYLWPSNLAELWLTFSGSYPYYYTFWLRGLKFVWQTKTSPLPRCLWPPKLGRGVTYREGKSDDRRVTWSRKTKWQTKIMYHLPQCLWLLNLAGWGYKTRSSLS